MNQFTFHHKKGDPAKVEMTVSSDLLNQLKDLMDLEIEIIQGTNDVVENDMHHCVFEISGYKREMFEDFIRMLIQHPKMKVKVLGLPINNN